MKNYQLILIYHIQKQIKKILEIKKKKNHRSSIF